MDVDKLRDDQIRLHSLTKADGIYTFYHDETNNIRKLELRPGGFNVAELKVFALGGVVHEGAVRALDIAGLRAAMRIQASVPELSLEYVGKGNFLSVLKSSKLTVFLRWISDNGLLLHYHVLDPLFWSVVDIVDAILPDLNSPALLVHHGLLKGDLTEVLRQDLAGTAELFHRYGYPGIDPQRHPAFLDELAEIVEQSEGVLPHFNTYMLKGVLHVGKESAPLDFSVGAIPNLLIDNFSAFYLNRLVIFKYAYHVLDMERRIQARILEEPLTSCGVPVDHYRFADSKSEAGIQLSDVVVGLIGKMFTYFCGTSEEEVAADHGGLDPVSLENAALLRDLITASDDTNQAFLHHVVSGRDVEKLNLFLRFDQST